MTSRGGQERRDPARPSSGKVGLGGVDDAVHPLSDISVNSLEVMVDPIHRRTTGPSGSGAGRHRSRPIQHSLGSTPGSAPGSTAR